MGKLYILKKFGLSIYKNMDIIALSRFLTCINFAWKGTLRP